MIDIIGSIIALIIMAMFGIIVYAAEQNEIKIPKLYYWAFYFFILADIVVQLATNVADYIMK